MSAKLIVALDFDERQHAQALVSKLNPSDVILKVGMAMYTRFGPDWVSSLIRQGFKVFLDLKYHDIPNTVADACRAAADLGVFMLNVHAQGGMKMMIAAKDALRSYQHEAPLLIAVTVLTSMSAEDVLELGCNITLTDYAMHLATMAKTAGLDGVVCSAHEASMIKSRFGKDFISVTPGIRLANSQQDDQSRIMLPADAAKAGSHYLVVGRPITQSPNPAKVVQNILLELEGPYEF